MIFPVTDFLTGYVVSAGAGLAGDPGLKASQHSTGGALSFETRERYDIRVVPG